MLLDNLANDPQYMLLKYEFLINRIKSIASFLTSIHVEFSASRKLAAGMRKAFCLCPSTIWLAHNDALSAFGLHLTLLAIDSTACTGQRGIDTVLLGNYSAASLMLSRT